MPTTVHELRGQSYMRHRPSYAGILHESRRIVVKRMAGTYAVNMSTAVLSVRLPEDLKRRLDDLGSQTGRSATFYVREAVESYIDDLEYAYALKAEAEAVRRGEIKTRRLDEIAAALGLDA